MSGFGHLRCRDAENAQFGEGVAAGVGQHVLPRLGVQDAGDRVEEQRLGEVLEVHVERGQHQTQSLAQRLLVVRLQHLLQWRGKSLNIV